MTYSITLPSDTSSIDSIALREIDTTVLANIDCNSGVPVMNWNSPFSANETISGTYMAGTTNKFRYVVCVSDKAGNSSTYADEMK